MKYINILSTVCLIVTLMASVGYCLEEFARYIPDDEYSIVNHERSLRVKRKGGKGGGRGKSSRKSATKPKNRDPYPKQPPHNPNYNPAGNNPSAPAYPKQPGQTGYGNQPGAYPGQTGYGNQPGAYPGQTGQHGYPGQTGYNPNYGHNTGGMGGMGAAGMGTGLGAGMGMGTGLGAGMGRSKGGLGGMGSLGIGAAGGVAGAALGAYGGYKLGKMVGKLGRGGHYGYYDDDYRYIKCDPPPRIETDPETNVTYIPRTVEYDARCHYYDRQPPMRYRPDGHYMNGADTRTTPAWNLITLLVTILVFGFRCRNLNRIEWNFWSHLLLV